MTIRSSNSLHAELILATNQSDAKRLRERADAVLWVRSQIARYGIALEDLEAAGCFAKADTASRISLKLGVRYKDANGHTWDGEGTLPDWLQRAVHAGQSIEHFKVAC